MSPVSGDRAGPAVATEDLVIYKSNQKRGQGNSSSVGGSNPSQVGLPCLALQLEDVFLREGVVFSGLMLDSNKGMVHEEQQVREIPQAHCHTYCQSAYDRIYNQLGEKSLGTCMRQ